MEKAIRGMTTVVGGTLELDGHVSVETGIVITDKNRWGSYLVATPRGVAVCSDSSDGEYSETTTMAPWNHGPALNQVFEGYDVPAELLVPSGEIITEKVYDEESLREILERISQD